MEEGHEAWRGNDDDQQRDSHRSQELNSSQANSLSSDDQLNAGETLALATESLTAYVVALQEENRWLREQLQKSQSEVHFLQLEVMTYQTLLLPPSIAQQSIPLPKAYSIHSIQNTQRKRSFRVFADFGHVAITLEGDYLIADRSGGRILHVSKDIHTVTTIAGNDTAEQREKGGRITQQQHKGNHALSTPHGIAVSPEGRYILFTDSKEHVVYRMDLQTREISPIAGIKGKKGDGGDGGHPLHATLSYPYGIAITPEGEIIIADTGNNRLRKISKDGNTISTIAGCGMGGYGGDGGPALHSTLFSPVGVAVDGEGNILFTDTLNNRVRRIDRYSQIITTIAGCGERGGYGGDGGPAVHAKLKFPLGIGVMKEGGHIIIADTVNHRIRRVDGGSGIISTIAGTGEEGDGGDGGPALQAKVNTPCGVAVGEDDGSILITDDRKVYLLKPLNKT